MNKPRVAVAMSGGVDSSVAAALLKEQGYEVIGLHMKLHDKPAEERQNKSCCSLDDALDARAVCARLGIPFYVLDFQEEFKENVMDYFVREYVNGRTPNPCVMCNKKIKNQYLLDKAEELDCQYLATGHYARIGYDEASKRWQIRKPFDLRKDQTYFLYGTPAAELPRLLFPLADYVKPDVRKVAEHFALASAHKPDSQEICFVPKDYREFIAQQLTEAPLPGEFINLQGEVLGQHQGLPYYTVGQRRGLGISDSTPYFVVRLDKEKNQVVLGKAEEMGLLEVEISEVNWVSIAPIQEPITATVKLRYAHAGVKARLIPQAGGQSLRLQFFAPERYVTPGQAAVFYHEDLLLGGGWIERSF